MNLKNYRLTMYKKLIDFFFAFNIMKKYNEEKDSLNTKKQKKSY